MSTLPFSKWSPGGNTTLLFPLSAPDDLRPSEQARLAGAALEPRCLCAEQAGFVVIAQRSLRMAGGEFCLNATRAFGALLALTAERKAQASAANPAQAAAPTAPPADAADAPTDVPTDVPTGAMGEQYYDVRVSGADFPVRLRVCGTTPHWRVDAELPLPPCPLHSPDQGVHLVALPGIHHLLLNTALHPAPDDFTTAAEQLRRRYGLTQDAAVGTIWWSRRQDRLEMLPLVHVREPQTDCLESSCGSGALALALCLAQGGTEREFSIMQPGGSPLDVRLSPRGDAFTAVVGGPVSLTAEGTIYLPRLNAGRFQADAL